MQLKVTVTLADRGRCKLGLVAAVMRDNARRCEQIPGVKSSGSGGTTVSAPVALLYRRSLGMATPSQEPLADGSATGSSERQRHSGGGQRSILTNIEQAIQRNSSLYTSKYASYPACAGAARAWAGGRFKGRLGESSGRRRVCMCSITLAAGLAR